MVADKKLRDAAKGNESVMLVPWKGGLLALQGHGLAIVRANLLPSEKDNFTFKYDNAGKCYTIPEAQGSRFFLLCEKYKVPCEWAPKPGGDA